MWTSEKVFLSQAGFKDDFINTCKKAAQLQSHMFYCACGVMHAMHLWIKVAVFYAPAVLSVREAGLMVPP